MKALFQMIIYVLTHKPCPICRGEHIASGFCCMCGGEGLVPRGHAGPEKI